MRLSGGLEAEGFPHAGGISILGVLQSMHWGGSSTQLAPSTLPALATPPQSGS